MRKDIEKENLLSHLYLKLDEEYTEFRLSLLQHNSEYVYSNAYKIDIIINIYEILLECLGELKKEDLQVLANYRHILERLYEDWMKTEDSFIEELTNTIKATIMRDKISSWVAV